MCGSAEITENAEWIKRYCIISRSDRKLYFFSDVEVSQRRVACLYVCATCFCRVDLLVGGENWC